MTGTPSPTHRKPLSRPHWLLCSLLAGTAWAAEAPAEVDPPAPNELVWSLGARLKMDDTRHPGQLGVRPMLGLRYGRWRTGDVDGDTWYRFGLLRSDNALTYDVSPESPWRTSVSASIVNLERDSTFDAFQSGRKTLRARAAFDYVGWSHWRVGIAVTQDLLGRGAGTAVSPSISYLETVGEDSAILLSHSFDVSRSDMWRYTSANNPDIDLNQRSGWGSSMNTSFTLRHRWGRHWSSFVQINRGQTLRAGDPTAHSGDTNWAAQVGVVYFER